MELRAASEPGFVPSELGRRIGEYLPVAGRSDGRLCDELRLVQALESILAGDQAELVIALAGLRPPERGAPVGGRCGPGRCRCRRRRSSSPTS